MKRIKTYDGIVLNKKDTVAHRILSNWDLYLLLVPGIIWYIMFCYKPMIGLRTSLYNYNVFRGIEGSEFVGLKNFVTFLQGPDFVKTLTNTLMISLWQICICFPFPILLAIGVTEMNNKYISKITQTATFLPYFISIVVVCGMVVNFLSPSTGVINLIRNKLGFESIYFMVNPNYFRKIYTFMNLWQSAGFNAIVYIAAIMGIDPQLYEAALMDGAGKFRRIVHVTFPCIIPTVVTMLILQIGRMVNVGYESLILLYNPSTYSVGDVISTYSYRIGLINGNYGLATAAGLFQAIISLILVVGANKLSKKVAETSLW